MSHPLLDLAPEPTTKSAPGLGHYCNTSTVAGRSRLYRAEALT